jgi:hypothetical protein
MRKQEMSRKAKKQTSSVPFSSNRWFRKISTARPSVFILSIIVIASAVFLFGGGLYTIIIQPLPSAYISGRGFLFLYPDLGYQFISDTVISTMLYALGFIGLLAVYQSSKYAYKSREAYMMLVIGVVLLFLAYIFLEESINIKLGR